MEVWGGFLANEAEERIYSVTTGLVKNNWDEEHPGMVKAEYFLGEEGQNVSGWIPVAMPYAFKDSGMYLLPEIGSEVVIAFNMGDRNCPIVIGSLWNQVNELPKDTAVEKNVVKRFRTKGGCEVVFEEEKDKEAIAIHTPADLKIRIEDENRTIAIEDKEKKNGILIAAKEGSVKVFADKRMVIEVGGKEIFILDGSANSAALKADEIKEDASKSYQLKAQNIKLEGTQTDIEGKSKLAVQSGGVAQLKGSAVKIN